MSFERRLHTALLAAFTHDDLAAVLWCDMQVVLAHVTKPAKFETVVSDFTAWAKQHGRLGEFLDKAVAARPQRNDLRRLRDEHKRTATGTDVRLSDPRLPRHHGTDRLIGRDAELQLLHNAWAAATGKNVVVFRAWGGVGKTALLVRWLGELAAAGWPGVEACFEWSFFTDGSSDAFFATALTFFGWTDPIPTATDERGRKLAELVAAGPNLLVLDGLEPLQHPPRHPQEGQTTDPAVGVLLKKLAQHNPGLCVVTTRQRVADLRGFYGTTAAEEELQHLPDEAGAALLHLLGVQRAGAAEIGPADKELKAASREVRGHALTLYLLGKFLRDYLDGDVRRRDTFDFAEADTDVIGGHVSKVLTAYEEWLPKGGRAGEVQLAILRLMGLFDRPADPGCLNVLRAEPAIPGLTDALVGLPEREWAVAVTRLVELGLLTKEKYDPPRVFGYDEATGRESMRQQSQDYMEPLPVPAVFHPPMRLSGDALDAHPLLRDHFAQKVRMLNAAWQTAHERLFRHLQERVPYWPEGLSGLSPLYQAVAHGCHAGKEWEACNEVLVKRIYRGTYEGGFYCRRQLGAIATSLTAIGCFFAEPWRVVSPVLLLTDQAWLLGEAANYLQSLGRLTDAGVLLRTTVAMMERQGRWKQVAISASNLCELELQLGEIVTAVERGEFAIPFADRSQDEFLRRYSRTVYADALHQKGNSDTARRLFAEVEVMQARDQPSHLRLYSLLGIRYCDLLLSGVEQATWRVFASRKPSDPPSDMVSTLADLADRADYAKVIAERNHWVLDIALDHLTLARVALYRAMLSGVTPSFGVEHLTAAVDGLQKANAADHIPRGLITRAVWRGVSGDLLGAKEDLNEAWGIAERGSMRLFMADILLTRARLFFRTDRDQARADLAAARQLIDRCGYGRRLLEVADAETAVNML